VLSRATRDIGCQFQEMCEGFGPARTVRLAKKHNPLAEVVVALASRGTENEAAISFSHIWYCLGLSK